MSFFYEPDDFANRPADKTICKIVLLWSARMFFSQRTQRAQRLQSCRKLQNRIFSVFLSLRSLRALREPSTVYFIIN